MLNKILTPLVNVFAPPKNLPGEHAAAFDFETYSPAGYVWDDEKQKYKALPGTDKLGLKAVGSAIYAEHPDTEVLSMAYDLHLGAGPKLWKPGDLPPIDLFEYLENGGLLEAWNITFERWIWQKVCRQKYGWPALPNEQLRDAMAKARAYALPGKLEKCGIVLDIKNKKDKRGEQLIDKFCKPRNPTKLNPSRRTLLQQDPPNAALFAQYNLTDIKAESEISERVPDLSPDELEFWQCDQEINSRGVQVDAENVKNCIAIIEQAYVKYNAGLSRLTGGQVGEASKVAQLLKWINSQGVKMKKLTKEAVAAVLKDLTLPETVRRVLEIRQALGSAAVKKLYALQVQTAQNGRVHDLFIYHSARTGRAAGAGPQPQNFPKGGPDVIKCLKCSRHCGLIKTACPWCGNHVLGDEDAIDTGYKQVEWNAAAVEDAIYTIRTGSLEFVEAIWGDAIKVVSGCLRGLFIAAKHHRLICSDYSAIEAVVLAALAGEEWRMEVFRTHGKIYEMSASKISGVPFSEFERHKKETDSHHPLRNKLGKIAELASGYQGWVGAWKSALENIPGDKFFANDDQIKEAVSAWRNANPMIVALWYGLEKAAISAIRTPDKEFKYRDITYIREGNVLRCRLPSGRYLTYHDVKLKSGVKYNKPTVNISFKTWNTNPKYGAVGWVEVETYGGKLTENVVQAASRDILAHAIVQLERQGYPVVLHVHDEIVAEVPVVSRHSIEEFEKIMVDVPPWASAWPIRARDGWQGYRYRK